MGSNRDDFQRPASLFSFELLKIVFLSGAISFPLNVLGAIYFLHPYKTLVYLSKQEGKIGIANIYFGSCLWGIFSGCIIYFFVNVFGKFLSEIISNDIAIQYVVVYFLLFSMTGLHFMINSARFRKNIGK